jgi:DsbC/DsbD-like thiol-disulfide interchange protein
VSAPAAYAPSVSRTILLALALLLACTGREREPVANEPADEPASETARDEPLVTISLSLIGPEAQKLLAARHDAGSPVLRGELLAVHHHITEPWHIYWLNPGESGLRTKLSLDLTGVTNEPVVYPGPDRFVASGGQVTYGWERNVVLFVPLIDDGDGDGDGARVKVRSDWLACHESCIPGHSEVSVALSELVRFDTDHVREMIARIPESAGDRVRTSWAGSRLHVELSDEGTQLLEFFPYANEKAVLLATTPAATALDLEYRFDAPPPADLGQGVLRVQSAGETRWLELAVSWPASTVFTPGAPG